MGRRRTNFDESAILNNEIFFMYLDRLTELSTSMFRWENVPDTIDVRFLELTLFKDGQAVFFRDETIGYLALQFAQSGGFDVYKNPIKRRAYAVNGYQRDLDKNNSVIIWNNYLRKNCLRDIRNYAKRLAIIDRIIDVNANAQKTPTLVQGTESQRLTLLNLYKEFDGNAPVIFGDKNLDINALKTLKTDAPFIADKLYQLKTNIWNEALTYLGISNMNIQKKERLISDEAVKSQGGTIASRYSRLQARREACEEINKMFNLELECNYREDYREIDDEYMIDGESGDNVLNPMIVDLRTKTHLKGGSNE